MQRLAIKNFMLGPQSSLQIFNLAKQVGRHVWQVRAAQAPPGYLTSMAPEPHPSPAGWPQNRTKRRYSPRTARGRSLYYVCQRRPPAPAPAVRPFPTSPIGHTIPIGPMNPLALHLRCGPCPPQPCGLAPRILRDLFTACAAGSPHPLRDLLAEGREVLARHFLRIAGNVTGNLAENPLLPARSSATYPLNVLLHFLGVCVQGKRGHKPLAVVWAESSL